MEREGVRKSEEEMLKKEQKPALFFLFLSLFVRFFWAFDSEVSLDKEEDRDSQKKVSVIHFSISLSFKSRSLLMLSNLLPRCQIHVTKSPDLESKVIDHALLLGTLSLCHPTTKHIQVHLYSPVAFSYPSNSHSSDKKKKRRYTFGFLSLSLLSLYPLNTSPFLFSLLLVSLPHPVHHSFSSHDIIHINHDCPSDHRYHTPQLRRYPRIN